MNPKSIATLDKVKLIHLRNLAAYSLENLSELSIIMVSQCFEKKLNTGKLKNSGLASRLTLVCRQVGSRKTKKAKLNY